MLSNKKADKMKPDCDNHAHSSTRIERMLDRLGLSKSPGYSENKYIHIEEGE